MTSDKSWPRLQRVTELRHYCEQRLTDAFARMPVTAYDAAKHSSLQIEALQLRPEPWSLHVRADLVAAETERTVAIPLAGDCLLPWLHDGDIVFVELGRSCYDGDLTTLLVPQETSQGLFAFTTKLLHQYRDRLLLLSNEPPAWYSDEKQQRFPPVGVVVAAIHYATPAQRSPELQAVIDASEEKARREYGDLWSANNLEYHCGHPIRS